jgi:DNA-binding cell septation regulator SpoVG
VKVSNWHEVTDKKALRGRFTVTLDSGMIIHKVCLFEKNGSRWIALPSDKSSGKDDIPIYTPIVEFTSRQIADNFRRQVIVALETEGLS